jgi:imidazolonepropionase-like amidohydrolase
VIDGTGGRPVPNAFIAIEDDRIAQVGLMPELPADLSHRNPLDLGGMAVLPGIMDMHVHLGQVVAGVHGTEALAKLEPEHSMTLRAVKDAMSALDAGVTYVRVVGQAHFIDVAIKRAFEDGLYDGPRILPSGYAIIATGGHGHNLPGCYEVDAPNGIRKAVRFQLRNGAEAIKLIITGGIGTPHEEVNTPQLSEEEITAAVQIAHWAGRRVAVHAGNSQSIATAARAGVDSVEHGYQIDEATADLMAERGTYLVPTLIVTQDPTYTKDPARPEWWRKKIERAAAEHVRSFERARRAGVKIVLGSDAPGIARHAILELETLVAVGMTPLAAIQAATSTAAELAKDDSLGAVAPGKFADLLVVAGDPSQTISDVRNVRLVLQGGRIVVDRRRPPLDTTRIVALSELVGVAD